jgi:hypothetical protein
MAVAAVDTGTATYNASALTQNFTFTVSATATLAVFYIAQDATQSITSVNWDSAGTNQVCTLVGSEPCPVASNGKIYIYAVVNPTSGASKNLKVVNGTATGTSAELQSYSGTVTSSVAAACTNVLVANGTTPAGAVGTAAQSGASGDMYVSAYVTNGTINSLSDTTIYLLAPTGNDAAGNRFASTGASHTLTFTCQSGSPYAIVSCDIVAAAATAVKWAANLMDDMSAINSIVRNVAY